MLFKLLDYLVDIDLGLVYAGNGLNSFGNGVLHFLCNINDVAAVSNEDNSVDLDGIVNYLNLDTLRHGLDANELGKLCTGSVGNAGNAVYLGDSGTNHGGDYILGNINAAVFCFAANIIITHF